MKLIPRASGEVVFYSSAERTCKQSCWKHGPRHVFRGFFCEMCFPYLDFCFHNKQYLIQPCSYNFDAFSEQIRQGENFFWLCFLDCFEIPQEQLPGQHRSYYWIIEEIAIGRSSTCSIRLNGLKNFLKIWIFLNLTTDRSLHFWSSLHR